jgi:DNA modification methylase
MSHHYQDATVTLHHGDCLDVLRELPDASVDAVVCDPPYGLEFMGKEWDAPWKQGADVHAQARTLRADEMGDENKRRYIASAVNKFAAGLPFQQWCLLWTAECLRVLKPGGHLLAFGGTRTWHRLACAVEDAGFEVRDSIAWLYGSGFPKSLDVSKAIASKTGRPEDIRRLSMGEDYTPSGRGRVNYDHGDGSAMNGSTAEVALPPDAERWQGWGTALKPAFEPIVVARKPLSSPGVNVVAMVELSLRLQGVEGEIAWTTEPANGAGRLDHPTSSSSTQAPPAAGTSADPAAEPATPSGEKPTENNSATKAELGQQQTPTASGSIAASQQPASAPKSSPPMGITVPAAARRSPHSSSSTTSRGEAAHTAEPLAARSSSSSDARDSLPATESFAGIATGLSGSWANVRIDRLADGTFVWPDGLPRTTAGGSTVAANVLAHGTGALNVDGCRVGDGADKDDARWYAFEQKGDSIMAPSGGMHTPGRIQPPRDPNVPAGRWPANVVLDESQAAALDAQSGESVSNVRTPTGRDTRGIPNTDSQAVTRFNDTTERGVSDAGGASRFFATFKDERCPRCGLPLTAHPSECPPNLPLDALSSRHFYTAKAPSSERVRLDGTAHPTVKPLALMRWLVRLVTPPGGTVLEPFAGSGTTVEACILEGFHCVAIEREADYLPLIVQRINRRRDPVQAVKGSGEDLGLFDLLDGESA